MNRSFDYNGVQIAPSKPVQKLVRRSRILHVDSGDRDGTFFPRNGNFTVYLPRAYERVIGINIKDAEFPSLSSVKVWDVSLNAEGVAPNYFSNAATDPNYFFLEIHGLNMSDETVPTADRSASTNSVFGKFVGGKNADPVIYNESSNAHQDIEFYPALTKMDRLQMRLRSHTMNQNYYMFWDSPSEWSISLEIQTLENSFDEYSTIETRLGNRS